MLLLHCSRIELSGFPSVPLSQHLNYRRSSDLLHQSYGVPQHLCSLLSCLTSLHLQRCSACPQEHGDQSLHFIAHLTETSHCCMVTELIALPRHSQGDFVKSLMPHNCTHLARFDTVDEDRLTRIWMQCLIQESLQADLQGNLGLQKCRCHGGMTFLHWVLWLSLSDQQRVLGLGAAVQGQAKAKALPLDWSCTAVLFFEQGTYLCCCGRVSRDTQSKGASLGVPRGRSQAYLQG